MSKGYRAYFLFSHIREIKEISVLININKNTNNKPPPPPKISADEIVIFETVKTPNQ